MRKDSDAGEKIPVRRRRLRPAIALATGFGVGYSPAAPGTLGAALGVAMYCALLPFGALHITIPAVSVALFFAGVHLSSLAEDYFREKDCQRIVFDELASFPLSMVLISPTPLRVALAFAFNRVADILKPFPAGRIQRLKGGWGVMLDDTVAAVYANLLLRLVILAFDV
ncbi:MAG: phosphatidylglycerophosphatase A [bacterium]|nr:phosphatidylglycerophosphatase A [bacterium]